jgi:tetratricopeptide (TPR) repeat protein
MASVNLTPSFMGIDPHNLTVPIDELAQFSCELAAASYEQAAESYELAAACYEQAAESYELAAACYEQAAESYELAAACYEQAAESYELAVASYNLAAESYQLAAEKRAALLNSLSIHARSTIQNTRPEQDFYRTLYPKLTMHEDREENIWPDVSSAQRMTSISTLRSCIPKRK